jgi:hypothetical protein
MLTGIILGCGVTCKIMLRLGLELITDKVLMPQFSPYLPGKVIKTASL